MRPKTPPHRARSSAPERPSQARPKEQRVTGANAVKALFAHRSRYVLRLFLLEEALPYYREELRLLAGARKPYRVVPREELDALAEGTHHEGVCAFAIPRAEEALASLLDRKGDLTLVGLPGVGNPHNLGAILRVAAHFGVEGLVLEAQGPKVTAAAARIAEGGAEHVAIARENTIAAAIREAKARGVKVLATSSHPPSASLHATRLPERVLLLFGAENEGLPAEVLALADGTIAIPGTGHVESLNVATAVAVVLGELARQRAQPGDAAPRRGK